LNTGDAYVQGFHSSAIPTFRPFGFSPRHS
jgi:hypothetical protein